MIVKCVIIMTLPYAKPIYIIIC